MKQSFKQFLQERFVQYIDTVKELDDKSEDKDINNKDKKNIDPKKIKYTSNLIKYLQQSNR
jgi:hypothetical protein